jgi:hypothetical protein
MSTQILEVGVYLPSMWRDVHECSITARLQMMVRGLL